MNKTQRVYADIYDAIISHLLDEGYVDCLGSAEIILENMSDEWLNDILDEGYKRYPYHRVAKKIDRMYNDPNIDIRFGKDAKRRNEMKRVSSHMRGEVHPLIRSESPKKSKEKERENRNRPESEKRSRTIRESY